MQCFHSGTICTNVKEWFTNNSPQGSLLLTRSIISIVLIFRGSCGKELLRSCMTVCTCNSCNKDIRHLYSVVLADVVCIWGATQQPQVHPLLRDEVQASLHTCLTCRREVQKPRLLHTAALDGFDVQFLNILKVTERWFYAEKHQIESNRRVLWKQNQTSLISSDFNAEDNHMDLK